MVLGSESARAVTRLPFVGDCGTTPHNHAAGSSHFGSLSLVPVLSHVGPFAKRAWADTTSVLGIREFR